jgi:hypothetical protein
MALFLSAIVVTVVLDGGASEQTTGPVMVGEPLHIYLRKDVPQQMLYLHFYPPSGNVPLTDTTSRFTLERKGDINSTVVTFFPRDINSNFLQFEPNSTVEAKYQLMLFASRPINASDNIAKLELIIEIDYERDNRYDERFTKTISFSANSTFIEVKGALPIQSQELKRFDGKRGGKVRLTLTRSDDLDTIVVMHCGSSEHPSYIQLPFSKYKYVPSEDHNGGIPPLLVVGIGAAIVVVFFLALRLLTRGSEPKKDDWQERRKGKRWSKKGKTR